MMGDFYRYEHDFEDEAVRSSNSFLSENFIRQNNELSLTNKDEAKVEKSFRRLTEMKQEECIVCLNELSQIPIEQSDTNIFLKTPCNHKFHKKCLLDWLKEKHLCPVCRTNIPEYLDDNI